MSNKILPYHTICILHDCEDFNDCDNFTPLNATKVSPEEKLHQL